jgi:hypothetical protein
MRFGNLLQDNGDGGPTADPSLRTRRERLCSGRSWRRARLSASDRELLHRFPDVHRSIRSSPDFAEKYHHHPMHSVLMQPGMIQARLPSSPIVLNQQATWRTASIATAHGPRVTLAAARYHRRLRDSPLHSGWLVVRAETRKDLLGSRGASTCRLLRRFQNRKPQEGCLWLAARRTSTPPLSTTPSFKKIARYTSAGISLPT